MLGLLGDDAGSTGSPDEPVPITPTRRPAKSTPSWGQRPVWYDRAGERVDARDLGLLGGREAARRHDEELREHAVAAVGLDDHRCASSSQVAAVTRVSNRMSRRRSNRSATWSMYRRISGWVGVALGPGPLLLELGRERVGVVHRLDVAAGAGVAVPPPRAAHVGGASRSPEREAEPAQPVVGVEAGEPGADDDRVDVRGTFGHASDSPTHLRRHPDQHLGFGRSRSQHAGARGRQACRGTLGERARFPEVGVPGRDEQGARPRADSMNSIHPAKTRNVEVAAGHES